MSALKTILYFSLFKYPLTRTEIFQFADTTDQKAIDSEIDMLLHKGVIFNFDGFYIDVNDPDRIERRLKGNEMARNIMPKAVKVSKKIAKFPYVKAVCLSGALSKGFYDDDGDFDFFIITKPNRLWIARTLLVLYKKIFLLNSKKYFCVNYFISTDQLEISEQNLFTATEIATLIPLYGKDTFKAFIEANMWAHPYFPNKPSHKLSTIRETEKSGFSKLIQKMCNGSFGLKLDHFLQKLTIKKWRRKFKHLAKEDFDIAMKSTRHVSKHHPQNYQNKVIKRLGERYTEVATQYNLKYPEKNA